jgi:hypothetical protein
LKTNLILYFDWIFYVLNRYTVIPRLAEILAETQKEKVTRMIVAFLRVS